MAQERPVDRPTALKIVDHLIVFICRLPRLGGFCPAVQRVVWEILFALPKLIHVRILPPPGWRVGPAEARLQNLKPSQPISIFASSSCLEVSAHQNRSMNGWRAKFIFPFGEAPTQFSTPR